MASDPKQKAYADLRRAQAEFERAETQREKVGSIRKPAPRADPA